MLRASDRIVMWLTIATAGIAGLYGLYLLALGPLLVLVIPGDGTSFARSPNIAGAIPLTAAVAVVLGIRFGRDHYVVLGAAGLLAFGVLFVFSIGGILIPVALVMLGLASVRTAMGPRLGRAGRSLRS